jgi:hypothetical protein
LLYDSQEFFDIGDAERFGGVSMKISFVLQLILAVAFGLTLARLWQGVYFSMAGFGMILCSFGFMVGIKWWSGISPVERLSTCDSEDG